MEVHHHPPVDFHYMGYRERKIICRSGSFLFALVVVTRRMPSLCVVTNDKTKESRSDEMIIEICMDI